MKATRAVNRILSIGECMVEIAPRARAGSFALGYAGDTFNTAWYAARALPGWQVDYLTAVGTDAVSDRMLGFMQAAGIGTGHIQRLPDRTVGLYLIDVTDGERRFSYWRDASAARMLAADASRLVRALDGARLAYYSGITLAILPPADRRRLLTALAGYRARGGKVAFDPNLRSRLWSDTDTMRQEVSLAAAAADIVLPSFEDEAQWFGDAAPTATLARYRAEVVVVKNGRRSIHARIDGGHLRHEPAQDVRAVDTTAAGDSFNAGFLAAYLTGSAPAAALAAGAVLAARVIGGRGALVD